VEHSHCRRGPSPSALIYVRLVTFNLSAWLKCGVHALSLRAPPAAGQGERLHILQLRHRRAARVQGERHGRCAREDGQGEADHGGSIPRPHVRAQTTLVQAR
jgi:hypothetical protein